MNQSLTFYPHESSSSQGGMTTLRLSTYLDGIIIGQAICKFINNPQNIFEQTATLSILSSIYGAIQARFEKVFEHNTAMRQYDVYSDESRNKIAGMAKVSGIGIAIVRELVEMLKKKNIANIEIEIAKGGGDNLISYYQGIGDKLKNEGVIFNWSHYRDGIRFRISTDTLPFPQ